MFYGTALEVPQMVPWWVEYWNETRGTIPSRKRKGKKVLQHCGFI